MQDKEGAEWEGDKFPDLLVVVAFNPLFILEKADIASVELDRVEPSTPKQGSFSTRPPVLNISSLRRGESSEGGDSFFSAISPILNLFLVL